MNKIYHETDFIQTDKILLFYVQHIQLTLIVARGQSSNTRGEYCKKSFTRSSYLTQHRRKKNCDQCNKGFTQFTNLCYTSKDPHRRKTL